MQAQKTLRVRNGGLTVAISGLILAAAISATPGWGGTIASGVLGQTDFGHNTANSPNAQSMYTRSDNISGVAVDNVGGYLYVADGENDRVLGYSDISALTNGEAAILVIGQPDFQTTIANSQAEGARN